jgi:hypothetical protein
MTDRNRNQDQPNRGQKQSSDDPMRRDADNDDIQGTASTERSRRNRASVADDRGVDRDRRSFSGDREHDELGSEMEGDRGFDRDDELDDSGSGSSER